MGNPLGGVECAEQQLHGNSLQHEMEMGFDWMESTWPTLMPQRDSLSMIKLQVLLGLSWRSIIIHVSIEPVRLSLPQKLMI